MKHDIIDRRTGNIVGCVNFAPTQSLAVISDLLARVASLTRLVDQLEDRMIVLEEEMASITDKHC